MRRSAGLLTFSLVIAVAAVGVLVGISEAPARATSVTMYEAFTSSGQIVPRVTYKSGYCEGGSYYSARPDAFRCVTGNYIYDPCYSSPLHRTIVVCPSFMYNGPVKGNTGLALRLTKPLDGANPPHRPLQPIVIETSSGAYYEFSGGATAAASYGRTSLRLNYWDLPDRGAESRVLWGYPDRRRRLWTILATATRASHLPVKLTPADRVTIRHAWL